MATTIGFIDCINRTDLAGLTDLMHPDHRLVVLDEAPLVGQDANVDAWRGAATMGPIVAELAARGVLHGQRTRLPPVEADAAIGLTASPRRIPAVRLVAA